jgi:hypothetical protein
MSYKNLERSRFTKQTKESIFARTVAYVAIENLARARCAGARRDRKRHLIFLRREAF